MDFGFLSKEAKLRVYLRIWLPLLFRSGRGKYCAFLHGCFTVYFRFEKLKKRLVLPSSAQVGSSVHVQLRTETGLIITVGPPTPDNGYTDVRAKLGLV